MARGAALGHLLHDLVQHVGHAFAAVQGFLAEWKAAHAPHHPTPQPAPEPDPAPAPDPDQTPDPAPAPGPDPDPAPAPEPDPAPVPEPAPEPAPEPTPIPEPAGPAIIELQPGLVPDVTWHPGDLVHVPAGLTIEGHPITGWVVEADEGEALLRAVALTSDGEREDGSGFDGMAGILMADQGEVIIHGMQTLDPADWIFG